MKDKSRAYSVSIRMLQEFIALARELNFSSTAKRLFISQPSLSNHIRALEENIGLPLFIHGQKPVLTPCGHIFLQYAEMVVHHYSECLDTLERYEKESFSLVVEEPSNASALAEAMILAFDSFEESLPGTKITLRPFYGMTSFDALKNGVVDVAKMVDTEPAGSENLQKRYAELGLAAVQVSMERPFVWLRENHPLSDLDKIPLKELAEYPILVPHDLRFDNWRRVLEKLFGREGLSPILISRVTETTRQFLMSIVKHDEVFVLPESMELAHSILPARGFKPYTFSTADECAYYVNLAYLEENPNPVLHTYIDTLMEQVSRIEAARKATE